MPHFDAIVPAPWYTNPSEAPNRATVTMMTMSTDRGAPAIVALLASLAAGCSSDTYPSGGCFDTQFSLDAEQIAMLENDPDPNACIQLCASFGGPTDGCSWSQQPDAGEGTAALTSDASGGLTSTGSSGGAAGDETGSGASMGSSSSDEGSTGASSGLESSSGGASTGPATTGSESPGGQLTCFEDAGCYGGRGHAALIPDATEESSDALGRWLARMAHAEAASVIAFRAIADELAMHGAPHALSERAREAAEDEVRHAAVMDALARARGAEPTAPRFSSIEVRDLEALALENAVEGCVRETWAALEAACQARRATNPALRHAMAGIAEDEARHAQLSWDLDAWARTRLSPEALARVDAARRRAVEVLEHTVSTPRPEPLHALAGLPTPRASQRLLAELRRALWS